MALLILALAIYTIAESSWSHRRRLITVSGLLCILAYSRFAFVHSSHSWVPQGIEAFFILRSLAFTLEPQGETRVVNAGERLARFFLWMFFLPTLCAGPVASYGDFYRSYRPRIIDPLQHLLGALTKIVWGGLKFWVLRQEARWLHETFSRAATGRPEMDSLPLLAGADPQLLIAGAFCLDMMRFYFLISGFIDIVIGISRLI